MTIEVRDIVKRFDGFTALDGVSLAVEPGELVALLGPSGSGKTTLLRIIAGLEFPTAGAVLFDGDDASRRPVGERAVGFVFQHYALFRHMTVFENVAFGLRVRPRRTRPAEAQIGAKVTELLHLVQLDHLARRYPSQLSGGQRQRVALARALAIEPRVLLLDEPFGALDAKVRKELRRWLRRLHDDMGLTSVFVTHDQEEALELADRVVVMDRGRIEQIGTPEEVYDRPATPFVYEFLGDVNRIECALSAGLAEVWAARWRVPDADPGRCGRAVAYVRPHDVEIVTTERGGQHRRGQRAIVRHIVTAGPVTRIELAVEGAEGLIEAELPRAEQRELGLRVGQSVFLRPRGARVFAGELAEAC
ncbi:MAG TPA: sulfate ABC transporter ATP-binding protein [Geminicoccaceae bacterium]|nr:sulfate ABC transporter ATP-binding protein [Geminicoccaceae bacterium]